MASIKSKIIDKLSKLEVNESLNKRDLIIEFYSYLDNYTIRAFDSAFYEARNLVSPISEKSKTEKKFISSNNLLIKRLK